MTESALTKNVASEKRKPFLSVTVRYSHKGRSSKNSIKGFPIRKRLSNTTVSIISARASTWCSQNGVNVRVERAVEIEAGRGSWGMTT